MDPRFGFLLEKRRFPRRARLRPAATVEIDNHLHHHALPAPGGDRELTQLISRLHSRQLDLCRPMWEVHVIEGLHDNRFAVYLKVHHALINGVDAVRLLGRSLATDAEAGLTAPVWATDMARRSPPIDNTLVRSARPSRTRLLVATVRAAYTLGRSRRVDSALTGPFCAPRSSLDVDSFSPHRHIRTTSIALERIKRLSKHSENTLNDVVLAMCSAALRRYLLEHDGLPDKPLIAGCPISIATPGRSTANSAIGIMFADLATDRADPHARLSEIARSTKAAKSHLSTLPHEALVGYSVLAMAPHTLRQLVPGAIARSSPTFNLIVSNVPGPELPRYLAGARMVELHPLSLLFKGEALNITAVSCDGQMNFGFTACRDTIPDLHLLTRYLEDAVDELENCYSTDEFTGLRIASPGEERDPVHSPD